MTIENKQTSLSNLFLNCLPRTIALIVITREAQGCDEEGEREIQVDAPGFVLCGLKRYDCANIIWGIIRPVSSTSVLHWNWINWMCLLPAVATFTVNLCQHYCTLQILLVMSYCFIWNLNFYPGKINVLMLFILHHMMCDSLCALSEATVVK